MLELYAAPEDARLLFDAELEPTRVGEHKGEKEEPAITTLAGRRNRIQIGAADPVALLERWPKNEALDAEIQASAGLYEFYSLRLACSFLPDRGCRFVWARMTAQLLVQDNGADEEQAAVAFDLFPRDVFDKQSFKRSFGVTPKLNFEFFGLAADAKSVTEGLLYEPKLAAAGLLTSSPTWTFTSADRHGLVGSRELFVLVRKPRTVGLEARFLVGGDVETLLGRVPLWQYRNPELIDRCYRLL